MNWSAWFYGLVSAILGAVGSAVTVMIVDPQTFNIETGWRKLLLVMAVSAILSMGYYLKSTPPPKTPSLPGP